MFGDVDLRRCCAAKKVANYPDELVDVLVGEPAGPWMYTGALENRPSLIDAIASDRELLGNAGDVLRQVRSPERLHQVLTEHGLPAAEIRTDSDQLPRDGSWLCKLQASTGGRGVWAWEGTLPDRAISRPYSFQRRIAGTPCAAVYVGANGAAALLGVTRQLIGTSWCGCDGFRYAGSIGPLGLGPDLKRNFHRLGQVLSREFQLVGLFGVDVVISGSDVWTLEINPRYTASIEILEWALGVSSIEAHVKACRGNRLPDVPVSAGAPCGKAIIYATRDITIQDQLDRNPLGIEQGWPLTADLPAPGTYVPSCWPVMTVLASGKDLRAVELTLRHRAREVQERLRLQDGSAAAR